MNIGSIQLLYKSYNDISQLDVDVVEKDLCGTTIRCLPFYNSYELEKYLSKMKERIEREGLSTEEVIDENGKTIYIN